jgi:hypothetical protein
MGEATEAVKDEVSDASDTTATRVLRAIKTGDEKVAKDLNNDHK